MCFNAIFSWCQMITIMWCVIETVRIDKKNIFTKNQNVTSPLYSRQFAPSFNNIKCYNHIMKHTTIQINVFSWLFVLQERARLALNLRLKCEHYWILNSCNFMKKNQTSTHWFFTNFQLIVVHSLVFFSFSLIWCSVEWFAHTNIFCTYWV